MWNYIKGLLTILLSLRIASPVPYWGKLFGLDAIFKLLAEDKFSPYITKDGYKCNDVLVSESGRWVMIVGEIYPIPLIKGLSGLENEFEMIDGESVMINVKTLRPGLVKMALRELFPPLALRIDDTTYDDLPSNRAKAFKKVWPGDYKELAYADWFEVRYLWEREYSRVLSGKATDEEIEESLKEITEEHIVYKQMFRRVLLDDELKTIAKAIKNGEIERPYALFDITNYSDEYCVCNGINVLKRIGYPANKEWMGFLFDCLKDIKKSYFNDAIAVLKNIFPKDELIARIDADIVKAHDADDLVWAAGLISLSKEIGYEITLKEADKEKEKAVSTCGTI